MMSDLEEDIFLLEDDFELIEEALYEYLVVGKAEELSNALKSVIEWSRIEVQNIKKEVEKKDVP